MYVEKERQYKIEHEINHKHTGGFGLGWIAIAIVIAAMILSPNSTAVNCAVGVKEACAAIAETYVSE